MSETTPQGKLDFDACYRATSADLRRYLTKLTRDKEIALDLTQDTFERIFRSIWSFKEGAKVTPWVYAIANNVARDYFRKNKIRQDDLENLAEESITITPEDEAMGRESERRLNDFLTNYKLKDAVEAFVLDLEECSDEEISKRQGLNIKTLRSRLHTLRRRALKQL